MFALVLIDYVAPMEEIERHTQAHRAYLRGLYEAGKLVASGPYVPRTGGALLFHVASMDEVTAILAGDPYHTTGVARHTPREWGVTMGSDELKRAAERG
jgi:uncharacterized protein YciI